MPPMNSDMPSLLAGPFVDTYNRFAGNVPNFAAAFLLLLLGMFMARALRTVAEGLFAKAKVDEYTSRVGINEVMARLGLGKSPSYGVSFLIYWFVLFVFIVSAANVVKMTVLSDLLERFLLFLPLLIAAILTLFGGLLFARFLYDVVANASAANNIRGGLALARGVYVGVVVFASITAMGQLGMQTALISAAVQIILASLGLAFAIAFGLGGRDAAADIIRELLKPKN